ncbi:unnamed protein product [Xylocopa violacea]|uniref:Uncharacterized protein n=1 Tax=Xylocopa violacea TaxID=135666 RepID=A0ABP1PGF2_XYLVO
MHRCVYKIVHVQRVKWSGVPRNYNEREHRMKSFQVYGENGQICTALTILEIVFDPAPAPEASFVRRTSIHYIYVCRCISNGLYCSAEANNGHIRDTVALCFPRKMETRAKSIALVPSNFLCSFRMRLPRICTRKNCKTTHRRGRDGKPQHECTRRSQRCFIAFILCQPWCTHIYIPREKKAVRLTNAIAAKLMGRVRSCARVYFRLFCLRSSAPHFSSHCIIYSLSVLVPSISILDTCMYVSISVCAEFLLCTSDVFIFFSRLTYY